MPGLKWKDQGKRVKRRLVRTVGFSRFEVVNVTGTWSYSGNNSDALTLSVNKAVVFHGVRFFGDTGGSQYEVKFTIKNKDDNVTGTYTSEQYSDGLWGYNVMLSKPIFLPPDEQLTLIATINGPESHQGQKGKPSVVIDDVIVTFKNAPYSLSMNGTSTTRGQFYKIFLSSV